MSIRIFCKIRVKWNNLLHSIHHSYILKRWADLYYTSCVDFNISRVSPSTHVNHTHHPDRSLQWDFLNNKSCDHWAFESIVEIVHVVYSSFSATNGILDAQMGFKIYLLLTFKNIALHFKFKKLTMLWTLAEWMKTLVSNRLSV